MTIGRTGDFKYWVQTTLPAVYDESLSYYELLNKTVKYLNDVITQVNANSDLSEETQSAFDELNTWARGEGLEDTLETILNDWTASNKLTGIINTTVFKDLQNQINLKATLTQLQAIASGSPKGAYATLTALQSAFPGGNTNIYVVVGDGGWYYWSGTAWTKGGTYQSTGIVNDSLTYKQMAPKGITRPRLKFYEKTGNNLFDKDSESEPVGYYNTTGAWDASISGYGSTGFIEIEPSTQYVGNFNGHITFWDANKTFISGQAWTTPFTTPSNAKYVNFAFKYSDLGIMYLNKGTVVLTYDTPKYKDSKLQVDASQLTGKIGNSVLSMLTATATANLLDTSKLTSGGYYHYSNGLWTTNPSYSASDFIPVTQGAQYTQRRNGYVTFWDTNKQFVSGIDGTPTFTIPSGTNIAFMRVTIYNTDLPNVMVVKNNTYPATYVPFALYTMSSDVIVSGTDNLKGLKWNVLGDSITIGANATTPYASVIANRTGIAVNNYGVSGTRITVKSDRTDSMLERYSTMDDTADIITVFGGTNDFGNSIPLGTWGDTVNTTLYGAMKMLVEGLITKYPSKRIGFILPLPRTGQTSPTSTLKNYINVIKEVCDRYSIPTLDLYTGSGLAPDLDISKTTLIPDGLHPNDAGHLLISRKIEAFIRRI